MDNFVWLSSRSLSASASWQRLFRPSQHLTTIVLSLSVSIYVPSSNPCTHYNVSLIFLRHTRTILLLVAKNISGSSSFSMSPHHNPTAITSIQASWSGMARLLIRWEWACRGQLMTSNCVVLTGPAARRPTPCNEDGDGHIPVSSRWPHGWKRVKHGGDLLGALRAQTKDCRAG